MVAQALDGAVIRAASGDILIAADSRNQGGAAADGKGGGVLSLGFIDSSATMSALVLARTGNHVTLDAGRHVTLRSASDEAGLASTVGGAGGLISGYAARRRLDICLAIAELDACDDTDDSANDWITVVPHPIKNNGTSGQTPPATCGNNTLEGLEGCDDGDTDGGDGCSAVCKVEPIDLVPEVVVEAPQIELVEGATHPLAFGDDLLIYLNQLVTMFNSHVHPGELAIGILPVTPAPPVPPFPPATPRLISTRVKTG